MSLVLFHFRLAKIPDVRSKLSISIKGYIKTFIGKLSDFYAIDFDCSDALYDEIMANPTKAVDYLDYAIKNYGKMALR